MSSQVLYRKYRPKSFDQVFGQEQVVKVLKGSLEQNNIGHAYLFSGPRGTGKTTMARILAREIGCDPVDIMEIDAASNRGIDDIRELRDGVHSLPFSSPYKMYIIDEVHMLTKEAFNALLKTLEEPPSHVIFVLATTELHKILPTVVSRCQSFIFRAPSRAVLKDMLNHVLQAEGYTADPGALDLIALLGNGSFRDTQGVLQKLISYNPDTHISQGEVEEVTGAPSGELVRQIIQGLNEGDTNTVFTALGQAETKNINPHLLLTLLTEAVRTVLLMRFSGDARTSLVGDLDPQDYKFYSTLAGAKNNIHSQTLQHFLETFRTLSLTFSPYLALQQLFFGLLEKE